MHGLPATASRRSQELRASTDPADQSTSLQNLHQNRTVTGSSERPSVEVRWQRLDLPTSNQQNHRTYLAWRITESNSWVCTRPSKNQPFCLRLLPKHFLNTGSWGHAKPVLCLTALSENILLISNLKPRSGELEHKSFPIWFRLSALPPKRNRC